MIALLGYNFFGDGNALDPSPTKVEKIGDTKITNGIFNHLTATEDVSDDSQTPPSIWIKGMFINAMFNGNLGGGSLQDIAGSITGYKIKRRKIGEFDWITIVYKQLSNFDELSFTMVDHLASNMTEYEYAFVPMIGNIEGSYIIKSIISKFNGVFVADTDNIFKLDTNVQFGSTTTNQRLGVYEPFGRKYPVVVSNGNISYETGQATGLVLNDGYNPIMPLDRKSIVAQRKLFVDFLNNRHPKILKDWNGQTWLIMVTNNPTASYLNGSGMGLANITFGWTEMGDADNKKDLYDNGIIPSAD